MAPLTEHQQEIRKRHLTASEVPAILGLDPWKNAADVWLQKREGVETAVDEEATGIGHMVEDGLLDWAADTLGGVAIVKNQLRVCPRDELFSATFDALVKNKPWALEAKTSGIMNPFVAKDEWGEGGTDEVPPRVIAQCQAQALVGDLEVVFVPALIGGRGRVLYQVDRSDEFIAEILKRGREFWRSVEEGEEPPEMPHMEFLARRPRADEKVIDLAGRKELLLAFTQAKDALAAAEIAKEEALAALVTAMGDAGVADFGDLAIFKYRDEHGTGFDQKRFREEHADLYAQYRTTFRRMVPRVCKPAKK